MPAEQRDNNTKTAPLVSFPSAQSCTLEWRQPSTGERLFQLRSGTGCYALLTFRSAGGTFATAETVAGTWTFKRIGFLNPKITIRTEGSDTDLAVYRPHVWGDGKIIFPDNRTYIWKPTHFWAIEWSLIAPAGEPLLHIKPGIAEGTITGILKTQATIEIARNSARADELALFATFCMYLFVIHQMDTAASSAALTATM